MSRLAIVWISISVLAGQLSGCRVAAPCTTEACKNDAQVNSTVEAMLRSHPALRAPNRLYVQTVGGVVYLSGLVDTDVARLTAVSIASTAPGVSRVVDSISIERNR